MDGRVKESGFFQFLCCHIFFGLEAAISSRRTCVSWAEDKWSAESGQEAVGEEDLSEAASPPGSFSF